MEIGMPKSVKAKKKPSMKAETQAPATGRSAEVQKRLRKPSPITRETIA